MAGSDLGGRDRRQQLAGVHVLSQVEGDKATVTGIQVLALVGAPSSPCRDSGWQEAATDWSTHAHSGG